MLGNLLVGVVTGSCDTPTHVLIRDVSDTCGGGRVMCSS